ncbi:MAG TPA: type II toxin-antitoxin system death-on-curing family toxin [Nitrososphaerales archaeon]|nr:type II toxin-antitoxin system death-on-curing family toxin [Nitrososphaerales archaeon]
MAKKTIHHLDFETLLEVNRAVVGLTKEKHEYSPADGRKLRNLVVEVEQRADNQEFEEAVSEKAALLIYDIARGQYFHAGNKRTALVAGLAFLSKNGHSIDIEKDEFVATVDKAGIAAADLDDLYAVVRRLVSKGKVERKGWDAVVKRAVEDHEEFLTKLAS